jgi:hypothetical protein
LKLAFTTSLAQLLGHLLGTAASIVGWVALAHHWLGMSTETSLLAFIAFATCGVSAAVFTQTQRVLEPHLPPARDFYVVTNENYRWNPATSGFRRNTVKPELGGTIYSYDNLVAAEMKYRQLEAEHSSLDLEDRDFSYHEIFGYDEEEARLWVVYAHSKTEAHDKVFYDDTRRYLGQDGRTDDLLLATNNEPRRQHYLDWWSPLYRAALSAEREEIEATMTYDAAIALFGFKELALPPDSIRCEAVEPLYAELESRSKELRAAATPDGKARNTDWKAVTTISVAHALISKRISDARACGSTGRLALSTSPN